MSRLPESFRSLFFQMKSKYPAFFILIVTASCSSRPVSPDYVGHDSVLVRVINKSDFTITSVTLMHDDSSLKSGVIRPGESAKLVFRSGGENVVRLNVALDNGKSFLTSPEMYVEGGYRIFETVYNDSIQAAYYDGVY